MEVKDVVAIIALVISLLSLYMSWRNARLQGESSQMQRELTERLKSQDVALDRKKLVTAMWDKLVNLWEIRPDNAGHYNETLVFENLNALELIAICWDNEVIDRRMVYLVCGKSFILRVKEIEGISNPLEHLRRTGPELLQERAVILRVKTTFDEYVTKGHFHDT